MVIQFNFNIILDFLQDRKVSLDEAKQICMKYEFPCIELVYGYAGINYS